MASGRERKAKRKDIAAVTDYGARAAAALDELLPGAHRDKTVARMFNCSVRMAQYLRAGQHWTAGRLSQASAVLGVAFDAALYSPTSSAEHYAEMADITHRLARLEARIAEVDRGGNAGLAPPARTGTRPVGREVAEPARAVGREVA